MLTTAKGALAGVVATAVLTVALRLANWLMRGRGDDGARSSAGDQPAEPPTERLAARLVRLASGDEPSPSRRRALGTVIHWTYGSVWGMAYAYAHRAFDAPTWVGGPILGVVVWLVGPVGLIPAMNLSDRPRAVGAARRSVSVLLHQIYGWTAAGIVRAISH